MEKTHLEILDENRKAILPKLAAFKNAGYLAGGTALALQIGHRISYDFDIFCASEIPLSFPSKIKKEFSIKETLINNQDEFTFLTEGDVKISFIFYPFDLKAHVMRNENLPLGILSPLGVALAKAYALNRRNSWRDYLDLYVMLKEKLTDLKNIVKEAQKVYGEVFNEKLFLAQLVYTEDISPKEVEETQLFSGKVEVSDVKSFFQKEIDGYLEGR